MRILYTLVMALLFCLTLNAQTVWTGNVDSDWANPGNWSAGVPTSGVTATIPGTPSGGNFPIYNGSPVIDFTIQNAGAITFDDFVYNNGTIINFTAGTLVNNNNYFVNAGSVIFDNDGSFTNTGTFENFGTFDNAASATFTNDTDASLINHGLFNNNGLVQNNGTFTNYGSLLSTNNIQNDGVLENHGLVDNPFGSVFTNNASGVINNMTGSDFLHNGSLQNSGNVDNDGRFQVQNAGTLTNDAPFNNDNDLQVSGLFLNNSTLTNNAVVSINDAGTLDNKSNVANNGTIVTSICGVIIQDSQTDIAATVLHDGIIYEIQGNVDETINEFGEVYTNIDQTKPPVAGCKSGAIVQLDVNGNGTLNINQVDKGSYASCGATVTSVSLSQDEFTTADLGAQTVTLTVEDNLGEVSTCDAVIFVVEYVPPLEEIDDPDIDFACPEDITVTTDPGAGIVAVSWTEPDSAVTNCQGVEICADRTASNTTQCNSGVVYGFYLKLQDIEFHYALSNGTFTEYEDGTAQLSGHLTNVDNPDYQFDLAVDFTGRTFSAPTGSPKENSCDPNAESDDWYYYTTSDGLLTGTNGFEGASISISRHGPAFQIGDGANATDGTNSFGASGWLDGEILSQPDNGPTLEFDFSNNPQAGDINIMLSGDGNECRPMPQCSDLDEIPGFIFMGEYNNSKYYCSNTSDWTWLDARAEAEANGGHLAIVEDIAENDFLQAGIIADYAWIGLTDEETEDTWKWVNGEVSDFYNWNSGEPNNGGGEEHYVRLLKSNGKWTDRNEWFEAEFIMEVECNNGPVSCSEVSEDKPGFTFIGEFNSAKYYAANSPADWGYAKSDCESNGGHLVVINDAAENDFIQTNINPASGSIWTGYTTVGTPSEWNWVNGDPDDYTNWAAGEPNGNGTDQAARLKKSTGEWTDRHAYSYNYEYVMEIPCDDTDPPSGSSEPVTQQISGPPNGGDFGIGVTEVAYQVTDDCGNLEICIFTVTVEATPAEITLDCPADIILDAEPGAESAMVSWAEPTATTTCFNNGLEINRVDDGPENGGLFPVGVTFVSYAVLDSCNNFEQCLLTITVNPVEPALTLDSCPADFETDSDNFTWDLPTASTTCFTGVVNIEQVDGPDIGSSPGEGVYEIAYLISDDCSNSEVCVFYVTVGSSCPGSGTPCDDGDPCTTGDVEDGDCNCSGIYTDSDGDGVCDAEDICAGGDDTIDTDGDGIPDFCDDCSEEGQPCDDGDVCTTGDVFDENCNCAGTYSDSDGDGVCDAEDICAGGDDTIDTDGDGIPDFCDDCSEEGQPCDDGDVCTTGDVFDENCNCAGTYADTDGDGVCDAEDICAGGDDTIDTDGDGIPDFCDDCSEEGQPCDDGDVCTTGDVFDENCNCVGTFQDTDNDGVCDEEDICEGGDDTIDMDGDGIPDFCDEPGGNPCDDIIITVNPGNIIVSNINAPIFNVYVFDSGWGTEFNCNYTCIDPTSIDLDAGTYYVKVSLRDANWQPICEIFETIIVPEGCNNNPGDPCDDGDACTTGDVYDEDCNCAGTFQDSDGDGVCDAEDICAGFDDNEDSDGDTIPDGCDTNECDNVTNGGLVSGDETGCAGYDPEPITETVPPSGGSGTIEFIWLASTTGCPADTSLAIPGATGASYDPGPITETTYYLRCSRRSDCSLWTGESNCIIKTVDDTDSDGDGVCDTDDVCAGYDDNVDSDGDGTPDGCDNGGDPCEDVVITTGPGNISISNVNAPVWNIMIFNSSWGTEFNCSWACDDPTTVDLAPGTYFVKISLRNADWSELCEIFETYEVTEGCQNDPGDPCDDGDSCTTGDVYDANCNCAGIYTDSDGDGVCDANDICEGFDDNIDSDGDTVPDGCDLDICDNVTDGGSIEGNESGCVGYDPAPITSATAPSGGSGAIEYLWLSSTTGCPTNLNQAIPGATEATYDPGTITETTYFVRCSRRSDCDSWTQGESNCITKTVITSDLDGDGVCDVEDICEGGDDGMDNDGDGIPNHCDDTPDGGGDPCENIMITVADSSITVSNIDAPIFTVMIFDAGWGTVYNCGYSCTDPAIAEGLNPGTYHVSVKLYDENWNQICSIMPSVEIGGGQNFVAGEEIFDFQANKNGRAVRLYWITNAEFKNDHFVVEHSYDGISFEPLLNVTSFTDNSGAFDYQESDEDPSLGSNYYRLKKVHHDGSFDYSVVRRVNFDIDLGETAIFPNPATNELFVDLQQYEGRSATISIFNHLGQRMDVKVIESVSSHPMRFDLSNYTGGAYTVYIDMEGTRNIARKFIVSRL